MAGVFVQPPWYRWLEAKLEPSWPAMVAVSLIVIGVTLWLLWRGEPVILAAWLTYLAMP